MPFHAISLARLADLHPTLAYRERQADSLAPEINEQIVQGRRSFALQAAYYAQGRQATVAVNALRAGVGLLPIADKDNIVVTKAPPGYGWHEYGLAFDKCPEEFEDGHPDWVVTHSAWQKMLSMGLTVGLAEGAAWRTFPDNPHFYPQELPASPGDDVRAAYATGGLPAVWILVNLPAT